MVHRKQVTSSGSRVTGHYNGSENKYHVGGYG